MTSPSRSASSIPSAAAASAALPLRWRTPPSWARSALVDPVRLLCDHAHLERKAATNALELLNRWPGRVAVRPTSEHEAQSIRAWVETLTRIAQDEIRHLGQVTRLLHARGGQYERAHENPYAAALRALVRYGTGRAEILDRLLVSALIELRSAERFSLLAADDGDPDLAHLYRALDRSERGHYRLFLELAARLPGLQTGWAARWDELLAAEAEIMAAQPPGPRLHSGVGADTR